MEVQYPFLIEKKLKKAYEEQAKELGFSTLSRYIRRSLEITYNKPGLFQEFKIQKPTTLPPSIIEQFDIMRRKREEERERREEELNQIREQMKQLSKKLDWLLDQHAKSKTAKRKVKELKGVRTDMEALGLAD